MGSNKERFLLIKGEGWVPFPDKLKLWRCYIQFPAFHQDIHDTDVMEVLQNILDRRERNRLPECKKRPGLDVIAKPVIGTNNGLLQMHVNKNDTPLGLKHFSNAFSDKELDAIEADVQQLREQLLTGSNLCVEGKDTNREKYFFGYHDTGHTDTNGPMLEEAPRIGQFKWLKDLCDKVHLKTNFARKFDQVVIIVYKTLGANFPPHVDPQSIFHYPFCSLRVFNARNLRFGYKGNGMIKQPSSWTLKQERGQITIMSGLSTTHMKHCIRTDNVQVIGQEAQQEEDQAGQLSVSFLFRSVRPTKIHVVQ
jgi:hypothetical protein